MANNYKEKILPTGVKTDNSRVKNSYIVDLFATQG